MQNGSFLQLPRPTVAELRDLNIVTENKYITNIFLSLYVYCNATFKKIVYSYSYTFTGGVGFSHIFQSGEFYWDDVLPIQQQGFTVEPLKSNVEPGKEVTITITWSPQSGYKVRKKHFVRSGKA